MKSKQRQKVHFELYIMGYFLVFFSVKGLFE